MTASASIFKKIGIASFIMMASVFASRIIGLVREMAIAWAGGARAGVDAYQIAFALPEILNHVVASGFLSITFIPIFARYISRGRDPEPGGREHPDDRVQRPEDDRDVPEGPEDGPDAVSLGRRRSRVKCH
ncbi:MAG: hypothetical protein R6V15_09240 [Desulfotignum sp.]